MIAEIRRRLGNQRLLSAATVASACDVSVNLIYTWIDTGAIEAVDLSTSTKKRGKRPKACWRIYRPSVIEFFRKRMGLQ